MRPAELFATRFLTRSQVLPAAPLGVGNLGRRDHDTNFPENDVWRDLCRWAETQVAPHIGLAYIP